MSVGQAAAFLRKTAKPVIIGELLGMGVLAGEYFRTKFHGKLTKIIGEAGGGDSSYPDFISRTPSSLPRKDKAVADELKSGKKSTESDDLKSSLIGIIKWFADNGINFLLAPCNTLMHYKTDMQEAAGGKFEIVDIIEETAKKTKAEHPEIKKVGLLATQATIDDKLYHNALEKYGIEVVLLDEISQAQSDQMIENVKKARFLNQEQSAGMAETAHRLVSTLQEQGAQAVILGCTEFPVFFDRIKMKKDAPPIISSTDALIDAGIDRFLKLDKARLLEKYGDQTNEKKLRSKL